MKWLRLYSDVLHNPKVQKLHPATFKHWINLLCLASDNDPRGELPDMETIAFNLRMKTSEAEQIINKLVAAGLLDATPEMRCSVHNWSERQVGSDDSTPRVRRHREAKAASSAQLTAQSNGDETLQKPPRGEERRGEEKNQSQKTLSPAAPKKKSAKDLVEEFVLEPKHREWASLTAPSVPIEKELAAWRDRMRACAYRTKQGPVADPQSSFYTAMRNAEAWGTYKKQAQQSFDRTRPVV